jgi:hypothetical protein
MADNKTSWIVDLDTKEATEKLGHLKEQIKGIGEEDNLKGMLEGLLKMGGYIALAAAAALAAKTAFEMVFEGENIKAINNQFETMAKNAGLAGDAIKERLVKAANGLADDTEILKAANESIGKLGSNASKLPEIMELARKSTAAMGGDLVTRFNELTTAIANGNQRGLKNAGILVDVTKAQVEYAKSVGQTVGTLSEEQKQQALMNAALQKGAESFKGVDENIKQNQVTLKQIIVLIDQIKEAFLVVFERTVGPTLAKGLGYIKEWATGIKEKAIVATGEWSTNLEGTEIKLRSLNAALAEQRQALRNNEMAKEVKDPAMYEFEKNKVLERINALKEELKLVDEKKLKFEEANKAGDDQNAEVKAKKDQDVINKQQTEFMKSLQEAKSKSLDLAQQTALSEEEAQRLHDEKMLQIEADYNAQMAAVKAKASVGELGGGQAAKMNEELEAQKQSKLKIEAQKVEAEKSAALDRFAEKNKTTTAGFSAGWAVASSKAGKDFKNFATLGEKSNAALGGALTKGFANMSKGSAAAAEAMKNSMLSSIGSEATARGTFMLLSSLWPPNPIGIAAGGGLIALGSALSGMGGGDSGGASVSSSGGGGGGGVSATSTGPSMGGSDATKPAVTEPKKSVSINVHGSYFETEQTKTRLMEMIRESSDATDFSFKQIGQ